MTLVLSPSSASSFQRVKCHAFLVCLCMCMCDRMAGKYQCTLNKHQCAAKARGDLAWRSVETQHYTPPPSSLGASQCSFRDNVDFRGGEHRTELFSLLFCMLSLLRNHAVLTLYDDACRRQDGSRHLLAHHHRPRHVLQVHRFPAPLCYDLSFAYVFFLSCVFSSVMSLHKLAYSLPHINTYFIVTARVWR